MNSPDSPKVVVLVQNDPYLVSTRTALLQRQGYAVEAVHTVEGARLACQHMNCDLVIVDSDEDYKAATELCDEIKAQRPEVSVAVVTWNAAKLDSECPDEIIRRERGPQEFINKVRHALA